ncbi:MAG: DHHA1 domain-containing protein [Anaerolineales bacterium]
MSWRSQPGVDVSTVAMQFGGGGHAQAAGAVVTGALADVQRRVLEATRRHLAG